MTERDQETVRDLVERHARGKLTREAIAVSLLGADNPQELAGALADRGVEANATEAPAPYLPAWIRGE